MEEFNDISKELTKIIDKQEKKNNGIFFTPKSYRQVLIENIKQYIDSDKTQLNILEPSFGSGEFINDIFDTYNKSIITGVEINEQMFDVFQETVIDNKNIKLYNEDFVTFETIERFDIIIGNPPYVVVKSKEVPSEFKQISSGRPNLYCWFLYKCIGLLRNDGVLAFVIPNSILNTSYYEPLRQYVHQECDILNIIHFDDKKFKETDQDTIGLILKKTKQEQISNRFIVQYNSKILFSVYNTFLQDKLDNHKTLAELGFKVKTGSIVWNQVKKDLTNDSSQGKLLVYSSNFAKGTFQELKPHKEKKQYIKTLKTTEKGPVILMHRGYGNGPYNMNVMFIKDTINGQTEFYAENHVNVIYPTTNVAKEHIESVYKYLLTEENKEYILKFTGNGAMSKTEIETMLPVCI